MFLAFLLWTGLPALTAAVNASQTVGAARQFIRDDWDDSRGYEGGRIYAIGQTSNGYLWIGSEKGLTRFDGLNFQAFPQISPGSEPLGPVFALAGDTSGNLLVSLPALKRLRTRNRELVQLPPIANQPRDPVSEIDQTTGGAILISTVTSSVFTYRKETFERIGGTPSHAISVAETTAQTFWVGTADAGLFRFAHGTRTGFALHLRVNCLLPNGDRGLWLGTDHGLLTWSGDASVPGPPVGHMKIRAMLQDRHANLWLAAEDGLYQLNAESAPVTENLIRISAETVTALFEDREGNLWVGGAQGIARFRQRAFASYPSSTTATADQGGGPLFADAQGRVWFGPPSGGLLRLQNGRTDRVAAGVGTDVVYSIAGGGGDELWLGRQLGGLTRLSVQGASIVSKTFSESDGLPAKSVFTIHRNRDGTVWAGLLDGGAAKLDRRSGHITLYTSKDGLLSNTVAAIEEDAAGVMWFATLNGISSLSQGRWHNYTVYDGLPPGPFNSLLADQESGVLWVGSDQGIACIRAGKVQLLLQAPQSLREQIVGLALDGRGRLWVATAHHVLRVSRQQLLSGSVDDSAVREYGREDGLTPAEGVRRSRSVITDPLGRIWFSSSRSISFVDPAQLPDTAAAALVDVQDVSADGSPLPLAPLVNIPAGRRRTILSFTGLSLAVPERVQFRYRLDGFDTKWSDASPERQAVYTNLDPGPYRFHVIASNTEGLWNGPEATLALTIQPAVWQTAWFRLLALALTGSLIFFAYRMHLKQVTGTLNLRFEERLSERIRIARELHDTLLQSFHGLILRFQAAQNMLPARPAQAREALELAIARAAEAITEGRDAVQALRGSAHNDNDLVGILTFTGQELGADYAAGTEFRVLVEGTPREIHPTVRDDLYHIAREALRNAFHHARAGQIEVEIRYDHRLLRLRIRDDGIGMDPKFLAHGRREGHWGFPGMRERVKSIGGQFAIWSELRQGTEVEVTIPGGIAYSAVDDRQKSRHPESQPEGD